MMMLRYPVVVVHFNRRYHVYLYDLNCEAIGATFDEALANLRLHANDILEEYRDCPFEIPQPSEVTIAAIELSLPATERRSDDASAA